jgi:hypothetical protein
VCDGSDSGISEMTFENLNNSLYLDMGSQSRDLAVTNIPGSLRVTIRVVLGQLREGYARRVKRFLALLLSFAQHLFNALPRVSSRDGLAFDVLTLSCLVGVGNAGEELPGRVSPNGAATWSAHFHKKLPQTEWRDTTQSSRIQQAFLPGIQVNSCFISESPTAIGSYTQLATIASHGLLTSGSQVRVLLGSNLSSLNFHKQLPQTLLNSLTGGVC